MGSVTRRGWLAGLAGGGLALALPRRVRAARARMLVLGAGGFVGQEVVKAAEAHGHEVCTVGEMLAPPGRFDAVLDCASSHPDLVEARALDLGERIGHYVRLSSAEAYADTQLDAERVDERAALREAPGTRAQWIDADRHAEAERRLTGSLGPRLTIVRPTTIVGPGDPADRLAAWMARTAAGGSMVAPGRPSDPVQLVDVRDVARFVTERATVARVGTFNVAGPRRPATMGRLLETCAAVTGVEPELTWIPASRLASARLDPEVHLPLWHAPDDPRRGVARLDTHRALAAGLRPRTLNDTVRDTLDWWQGLPELRRLGRRTGLDPRREAQLLRAGPQPRPVASRSARTLAASASTPS